MRAPRIAIDPRNAVEQAIARDRAFFQLYPSLTNYRRRYVRGEHPDSDALPDGTPLAWTCVYCLTPDADARIRLFEPDNADAPGPQYLVTDGDSVQALHYANTILQQSVGTIGGRLREVR